MFVPRNTTVKANGCSGIATHYCLAVVLIYIDFSVCSYVEYYPYGLLIIATTSNLYLWLCVVVVFVWALFGFFFSCLFAFNVCHSLTRIRSAPDVRNSFSLLPGITTSLLNVQNSPLSAVARHWGAPCCEKAGAAVHITGDLESHVRPLCGSPGWWGVLVPVLGPIPAHAMTSHLIHPIPCAGSMGMVFFTCSQLLRNIAECCLIYTRWLGLEEKLNETSIWFMYPFCKVI